MNIYLLPSGPQRINSDIWIKIQICSFKKKNFFKSRIAMFFFRPQCVNFFQYRSTPPSQFHPGGHYWDYCPGALSLNQVSANSWRSGTCRFHLRELNLQMSLQWLDWEIGHQSSGPGNVHQGDMPYFCAQCERFATALRLLKLLCNLYIQYFQCLLCFV